MPKVTQYVQDRTGHLNLLTDLTDQHGVGGIRVLRSRSRRWAGAWLSKGQGQWILSRPRMTYNKLYQKSSDHVASEDENCLFISTCWAPSSSAWRISRNPVSGEYILSNKLRAFTNLSQKISFSVLKMHCAMASHFPQSESQSPVLGDLVLAASLTAMTTLPSPDTPSFLPFSTGDSLLCVLQACTLIVRM